MYWFLIQAEIPPLPRDLEGETFSHVFGTHTSWWDQELWLPNLYFYLNWYEIKCLKEAFIKRMHVHYELACEIWRRENLIHCDIVFQFRAFADWFQNERTWMVGYKTSSWVNKGKSNIFENNLTLAGMFFLDDFVLSNLTWHLPFHCRDSKPPS